MREEKVTAIYVVVRESELTPQDQGSYARPLKEQEEACRQFLKERVGGGAEGRLEVYMNRGQLLRDLERGGIERLILHDMGRLGSSKEEIDGILFELRMQNVEVLCVQE